MGIFTQGFFAGCDRSDGEGIRIGNLKVFCLILSGYEEFFWGAVVLHKDFKSLIAGYKIVPSYFPREYFFHDFPVSILYNSLNIHIFPLWYVVESLFYGSDDIVSFESIEYLISREPFIQRFLSKIRIHDIGYIVYIDELPLHFSQFINNFVEIHHGIFCFII